MSARKQAPAGALGARRAKRSSFKVDPILAQERQVAGGDDLPVTQLINIDLIDTDSKQARALGLDVGDPSKVDPDDPRAAEKRKLIAELRLLGESINRLGLIHAVRVARNGERFQLMYGERRVMASRLMGRQTIRAEILNKVPPLLRLTQHSENAQRRNLSIYERAVSTAMVIEEAREKGVTVEGAPDLEKLMSLSPSNSFRYWCLGNLKEPLLGAAKEGLFGNIAEVHSLFSQPLEEQERAVEALREKTRKPAGPPPRKTPRKAPRQPSQGAGFVVDAPYNPRGVEMLMRLIVGEPVFIRDYKGFDWGDPETGYQFLSNAIKAWLKRQEDESETDD